tara:strand:+ start:445 stop:618 length:174 start_codon:yes stop_codon:yes gene_type:complete
MNATQHQFIRSEIRTTADIAFKSGRYKFLERSWFSDAVLLETPSDYGFQGFDPVAFY